MAKETYVYGKRDLVYGKKTKKKKTIHDVITPTSIYLCTPGSLRVIIHVFITTVFTTVFTTNSYIYIPMYTRQSPSDNTCLYYYCLYYCLYY